MTIRRSTAITAISVSAALALAGCGGSDEPSAPAPQATTAGQAKTGGTLTANFNAFPDFLDPALAYTQEAWTSLWPVYTSLLTYKHAEGKAGAELVPGLAEALPDISADGKTYRLKLRQGLKFSDGTPVQASNFERAVKRVLNLESGGAYFFENIEGAKRYEERGKPRADISGIETDDATGDITIKLEQPDGQFSFALAMLFSAPVPMTAPFDNATSDPIPGVGPYELADVKPGRSFSLVKSKTFQALPEVPVGRADRFDLSVVKNQSRQATDVIDNKVDLLISPPSADSLARVKTEAEGRYREYTTNSTTFFFLNSAIAPFDDEKVRQAVATAVDERALARLSAGLLTPDCNFLPPGVVGYEEIEPCPWGDPNQAPDLAKAKELVAAAGATGKPVSVYGEDSATGKAEAEYFADLLNQLGFDAKPQIVSGEVYFQTVGNAKTKAQAGIASWQQDYPGPANFFQLIDGAAISPTNNQNLGNVDDPEINETLVKANALTDQAAAAPLYAQVDRRLVERALVLPFGHGKLTKLTSDRVDFAAAIFHPVYAQDLSSFGLR